MSWPSARPRRGCLTLTRYPATVVVVVTGAAGSGKTTIGRALSDALGWRFIDGDDYHSPASIAKMRAGAGLTDADRAPWLASLHREIAAAIGRRAPLVVACSALRESYRRTLCGDVRTVRFVLLDADERTLRRRLEERTGHFAGPSLVATQLATLERSQRRGCVDRRRDVSARGNRGAHPLRVRRVNELVAGSASTGYWRRSASTRSQYSRFGNSRRT